MEVKIYYDGGLNVELDKLFEKTLQPLGLRRWASGMDMGSLVRGLAFTDRPKKEIPPIGEDYWDSDGPDMNEEGGK